MRRSRSLKRAFCVRVVLVGVREDGFPELRPADGQAGQVEIGFQTPRGGANHCGLSVHVTVHTGRDCL